MVDTVMAHGEHLVAHHMKGTMRCHNMVAKLMTISLHHVMIFMLDMHICSHACCTASDGYNDHGMSDA